MKIGVIGSGNVGGTLGRRWARAGHEVAFGSRTPQSTEMTRLLTEAGATARATSTRAVVEASEVLLLATPWAATLEILKAAGRFEGKVLIDATNPILPDLSGLEYGGSTSGAEMVSEWATGAKVVKAFNTVGSNIMANPDFGGRRAAMLYCGDDLAAKQIVKDLALELGFDAHDAGPLKQSRLLEPFAMLWISLAVFQGYGREFAFELHRR